MMQEATGGPVQDGRERRVLEIIEALVVELGGGARRPVTSTAALDRDLGIGSLERAPEAAARPRRPAVGPAVGAPADARSLMVLAPVRGRAPRLRLFAVGRKQLPEVRRGEAHPEERNPDVSVPGFPSREEGPRYLTRRRLNRAPA